jgi:hypothetical protein
VTIDDVLRARAGERLRLSVFPASTGYQASLSSDDGKSWRVEMADTPDTALKKALGILPGASGQLWTPASAAPTSGAFD